VIFLWKSGSILLAIDTNNFNVQDAHPYGAAEQAVTTKKTSISPFSFLAKIAFP
jgi:hypothetical protein